MKSVVQRNLKTLLDEGREAELADMLARLHPADVAEILNPLDMEDTARVIALMDIEQASDVLVEMSAASRDQVAAEMPVAKLSELVAEMDSDDAADIVAELPDEEANQVLAAIEQKDAEGLRRLMMYDEETAGGLMQVEVVSAVEDDTVARVVERLRLVEDSAEVYYVFVVDQGNVLRGQVTLRQLLLATPDQTMGALMAPPDLVVRVDDDQEQVAQNFQKYDIQAAPVIDDHGHLLGRVTFDDIMDVVHEEIDQDFYRMAGSSEEEVYTSGPAKIATLRLPWLVFNLVGGFITATILKLFEVSLSEIQVLLIPFVPMVMGLSGAVGSQSATITVRGLSMGRIIEGKVWPNLWREVRISYIIAAILGMVIALGSGLIQSVVRLGVAVGASVVTAIVVSTILGAVIPLFFKAVKIDPALASGPVVTSVNDVVSLLIYMLMGTAILSW
ncbi:MAG: magnesium transporter [Candidatus Adiutrix sp.]|jgi:magnesium transporter|nr:magnesium transporter [Candidatus Adiutrix sp.]